MEASFNPEVLAGGYFLTSPPNPHTLFSSLSKERTSNEWPRVLPENRDPPDGAIHIYILAYITQCESHFDFDIRILGVSEEDGEETRWR